MVQMGLLFVGFTILILFLLLLATVYYVPKVLDTSHGETDDDHGSGGPSA